MQQSWFAVLGAAFVGAALALLGNLATKWLTGLFIEAPGLRAAVAAEIRVIIDLINRDNVIGAINEQIIAMENSRELAPFRVSFRSTYNIVFAANASKLNLLRRSFNTDLVTNLVSYYYLVQTMIELSDMIWALDQAFVVGRKPILGLHIPPQNRLDLFKRLQVVAKELLPLAQDLVNRLEGAV